MYKIAEGINSYKTKGKRYGYMMEGDDHLADINAGVTEIIEENIELKQRVKNLKEEK
jgi:cell division septum initiation protein DivIVA